METLKEEEEELKKKVEQCKVRRHLGLPGCVGVAEVGAVISQIRKLTLTEVVSPAQGHVSRKRQSRVPWGLGVFDEVDGQVDE